MSGFSGIIGRDTVVATPASTAIAAMAGCLDPDSPDPVSTGVARSEQPPAEFAWSKKNYENACVAWNDARDIGLIFVGEDFDADAKVSRARSRGANCSDDVSCLLASYEELGVGFLSQINGRFAGLVIDHRAGALHLFNDRFGLNRVYVHESARGLLISTQARSILAVAPECRRIEERGLAEYYSVGCVLQHRTLFTSISILPPASRWTIARDGSVQKRTYFDPRDWEQQEALSPVEYGEQLAHVFGRIVPKYLRGSAGVGMSLTGGLDSRMILAWLRNAPGSLPCYTFGGPYRDCADVRIARQLAAVSGHPHTTLRIGDDFFADFPNLARRTVANTDGTMDVSGAIELYANRRARQIAPIRLTGNYGSEILRANVAFRPARLDRTLFTPEFSLRLDEAAETYRQEAACRRLTFIAFKQVPWHHFSRFAAERTELSPRSPFLDNELVALAYRAPQELEGRPEPLLDLITRGNPGLNTVRTDRALTTRSIPVLGSFRRHWQEFTAKAEYAYDYGMPRWLTRADTILKPLHLERLFLGRHKFYHYRVWYRDRLGSILSTPEFTSDLPWYRTTRPSQLIAEHRSGRANRTLELHKLLSVQLLRRMVDQ